MNLTKYFHDFKSKRILIVGDAIIDTYLWGEINRMSPEAPVPVVKFETKEHRLGGAANVALNIKALGAKPFILSIVGEDDNAKLMEKLINENHLPKDGLISSSENPNIPQLSTLAPI